MLSKKQLVAIVFPQLEATSADLELILRSKNCSSSKVIQFFGQFFDGIDTIIRTSIMEGNVMFMNVVDRDLIPVYLIEEFLIKLQHCIVGTERSLHCLLKVYEFESFTRRAA